MNQPVQHVVVNVQNKSNGLGLAGLILSCIGWLTCGLLCIPGALFSFLGLLYSPRGTAIAGLIVGFPGVIFFFLMGMGMLGSAVGIGVVATGAVDQAREAARKTQANIEAQSAVTPVVETEPSVVAEESQIDSSSVTENAAPSPPESQSVAENSSPSPIEPSIEPLSPQPIPDPVVDPKPETAPVEKLDPKTVVRTFSDVSGKFKVDAKVTGYKSGWVQLERADNGKTFKLEVKKLSENDQLWLKESFGN